jgi:hypothetical protein
MFSRLSEVVQDLFTVATGILEGIGQDWQAVEGFLLVDACASATTVEVRQEGLKAIGRKGLP